jgi:putative transposase
MLRHEGSADTLHPSIDHDRQAPGTWWRKGYRRRQSAIEAADPHHESRPAAQSQSLVLDRFLLGFWSLFLSPWDILRAAVIIRPSTLLKFHRLLKQRKYRLLYSASHRGKPGPKGPSPELIQAILELNRRNPRFGCPRIVQQINKAFGIDIDKDIVRRVLASHYRPIPGSGGPSWLTFLGHTRDSLWSVDQFRCESILLKSHWVLVVMDQFTRRIIGFGVHVGDVDGIVLCRMFNMAISARGSPNYLSSDNDPLFLYHQWQANLRILGAD